MTLGERSYGDYPRELRIDAIEDGGTRRLFGGNSIASSGAWNSNGGDTARVDVSLPSNRASAIRLSQVRTTRRFFLGRYTS